MAEQHYFQFGPFCLEATGRLLLRHGKAVPLPPKAADTLLVLLENAGKLVEKEELLKTVWHDAFIEEGSLTRTISILRKVLSSGGEAEEYIATVSKRGYRFVAPVELASAATKKLMLAVLPFENFSGDKEQEYFSDGLTEEMITQLSRLHPERLAVIARTSAMKYKATSKSVQEIGRELDVAYVLEGSVRRAGKRVRITAQLVQVADQTHLWAESYERDLGDVLLLQSEVSRAIAQQIEVKLTPRQQQRLDSARPIDPQAHEAYLRGRYLWNKRTEEAMRKSIESFEGAIARDPGYAAAYDGVSDAYVMLACRGVVPPKEAFHRAKTAARQALQIEQDLGEGYASLAHVRLHDWDWIGLEDDFRRALELSPGHAIAHYWYAEYLMAMGRCDEAIARVQRAQQLDPVNAVLNASVGMILYLARRYDQAIEQLRKSLETDPDHFLLHFRLGLAYMQVKKMRQALAEMKIAVDLSGRSTEALTGLAQAYATSQMEAAMHEVVDELERQPRRRYVSPYNMSRIYGSLGGTEKAFHWLETAYEEHNPDLIELKMEPVFDSIRSDARFAGLLRRVGWRE